MNIKSTKRRIGTVSALFGAGFVAMAAFASAPATAQDGFHLVPLEEAQFFPAGEGHR